MSLNVDGIVLSAIAFVLILLTIGIHPFIRKITNNYFFWIVISIAILSYFIIFRFLNDWISYTNAVKGGVIVDPENDYAQSMFISKAFLTDFCPFLGLFIPLSLIFDPKRKIAMTLSPLSLLAALITLFGQFPFDNSAELSWQFIFIGWKGNEIYYFLHLVNAILAILVLLNTPKFKWINFLFLNFFALTYFLYVANLIAFTGVSWNVSGLSPKDWIGIGEYSQVSILFGLNWPWVGLVSLIITYCSTCFIIIINNYTLKKIKWWCFDGTKGKIINPYNIKPILRI